MTTEQTNVFSEVQALSLPDVASITRSGSSTLAMAKTFLILNTNDYQLAGEELGVVKKRMKTLEELRTSITGPMNKALKAVNELFKGPMELYKQAEDALKQSMLSYSAEEERKALEAQQAAAASLERERARLEEDAKKADESGAAESAHAIRSIAAVVSSAPLAQVIPVSAAGTSIKTTVDFEVEDLLALVQHIAAHPELIALVNHDSVKLRAYVRSMGLNTKLPGVKVFEKRSLSAKAA